MGLFTNSMYVWGPGQFVVNGDSQVLSFLYAVYKDSMDVVNIV